MSKINQMTPSYEKQVDFTIDENLEKEIDKKIKAAIKPGIVKLKRDIKEEFERRTKAIDLSNQSIDAINLEKYTATFSFMAKGIANNEEEQERINKIKKAIITSVAEEKIEEFNERRDVIESSIYNEICEKDYYDNLNKEEKENLLNNATLYVLAKESEKGGENSFGKTFTNELITKLQEFVKFVEDKMMKAKNNTYDPSDSYITKFNASAFIADLKKVQGNIISNDIDYPKSLGVKGINPERKKKILGWMGKNEKDYLVDGEKGTFDKSKFLKNVKEFFDKKGGGILSGGLPYAQIACIQHMFSNGFYDIETGDPHFGYEQIDVSPDGNILQGKPYDIACSTGSGEFMCSVYTNGEVFMSNVLGEKRSLGVTIPTFAKFSSEMENLTREKIDSFDSLEAFDNWVEKQILAKVDQYKVDINTLVQENVYKKMEQQKMMTMMVGMFGGIDNTSSAKYDDISNVNLETDDGKKLSSLLGSWTVGENAFQSTNIYEMINSVLGNKEFPGLLSYISNEKGNGGGNAMMLFLKSQGFLNKDGTLATLSESDILNKWETIKEKLKSGNREEIYKNYNKNDEIIA